MLRLNQKERDILLCGQLQANASIRKIAKQTGYREHTVRYLMEKFKREGVIHSYPFINIFPLGYQEFGLFFSLMTGGVLRKRFLKELKNHSKVSWVLELGGDFNFGVAVCARSGSEVTAFLRYLSESFGTNIIGKSVSLRTSWSLFPRKYLSKRVFQTKPLICAEVKPPVEIDDIDCRLLTALSRQSEASLREIAFSLQLSLTTAQNRIKRLTDAKVIVGHAYEINPKKIGAQGYRLLIYTKAMTAKFRDDFYKHCEDDPHIFALIECVGSWDFELKVEVEHDDELHELTGKLYQKFPLDLSEIKVLMVFDTPKLSFYPFEKQPLDSAGGA